MLLYILSDPVKETEVAMIKQCRQRAVRVCVTHFQSSVIVEGRSDNDCCCDGATLTFAAASTALRPDSSRRPRALDTGAA